MNPRTSEQNWSSRRSVIALAFAIALLTMMAAVASGALAAPEAQAVLQQETLPPPTIPAPGVLDMQVLGGPNPFCPGWRLHYRLIVTNTSDIELDDITVTAYLPSMIYNAVDGGSTVPGTYNPIANTMEWALDTLPLGGVVNAYTIVNSFTSIPLGSVLSTTFVISSPMLAEEQMAAIGYVANSSACDPTATPTTKPSETPTQTPMPTATITATPSPTEVPILTLPMYFPFITNQWVQP